MSFTVRQVIIVTQDVKFSMNAKRALERDGTFAVQSYTKPNSAIDALIQIKPDAVILDFRVPNMRAHQTISQFRLARPGVVIIAAPTDERVLKLVAKLDIQAVIDIPYPLSKLGPLLHNSIRKMQANQPDTQAAPNPDNAAQLASNYQSTLEFWLSDQADGSTRLEKGVSVVLPDTSASRIFEQLAAEEPPMPSLKDGGTVSDLRDRLLDPKTANPVITTLPNQSPDGAETNQFDPAELEMEFAPVNVILETTLDPSTPISTFSYDAFRNSVKKRNKPGQKAILPLPSWVKEDQRYIIEPDFLSNALPSVPPLAEYSASTTLANNKSQEYIEANPEELPTEQLELVRQSRPLRDGEREILEANLLDVDPAPPVDAVANATQPVEDQAAERAASTAAPAVPQDEPADDGVQDAMPFVQHDMADKRIAQLALTLTQVSLELAVQATFLARGGRMVAYAGKLPPQEIEELRHEIGDDWEAEAGRDRLRFVTLPSTKVDYMMVSRRSVDDYTLSMIFPGSMPVQLIRRQGGKLDRALSALPQPEVLPDPLPLEVVGVRTPHTFVWLLDDPQATLPADVRATLQFELQKSLLQEGWFIHAAAVRDDHVYLYADVPQSVADHNTVRELMRLSAIIVQQQMPAMRRETLWHSSFLLLKPGRAIDTAEIARFIRFARR